MKAMAGSGHKRPFNLGLQAHGYRLVGFADPKRSNYDPTLFAVIEPGSEACAKLHQHPDGAIIKNSRCDDRQRWLFGADFEFEGDPGRSQIKPLRSRRDTREFPNDSVDVSSGAQRAGQPVWGHVARTRRLMNDDAEAFHSLSWVVQTA